MHDLGRGSIEIDLAHTLVAIYISKTRAKTWIKDWEWKWQERFFCSKRSSEPKGKRGDVMEKTSYQKRLYSFRIM